MHHNIKDQPTGDDNGQVVGIENAEAACLDIEKGQNKTFKSLKSKKQDLSFISLEKAFQSAVGMQTISKDILKTLELFTENEGYNKAAELLADNHAFYGIDIVKFGDNINIILDRETFEHISVLDQFEKTMNMYRKYYQYEEIRGHSEKLLRLCRWKHLERRSPMRLFTEHGMWMLISVWPCMLTMKNQSSA